MQLPDVPVPPEYVLNEYFERLVNMTSANVRLTVMIRTLVEQRDSAMRRVAELEAEVRGGESVETETVYHGNPQGV